MTPQTVLLAIMLFSAGIIAGFLSGLLGIGGGVIFVPILMFVSGLSIIAPLHSIHVIVATSLFAGMFTSATSFLNHKKTGNVNFGKAIYLTTGTVISAVFTPKLMLGVEPDKLKIFIGAVVGLIGLFMLFEDKIRFSLRVKLPDWTLLFTGALIGAIAVSSGLGGGVFFTPVLVYLYSENIKKAIGTSTMAVVSAMSVSCVMFLFFTGGEPGEMQVGYVNLLAGVPLALGGIVGPKLGVQYLHKASLPLLRKIFSIFLILYSIKIFGI